VNHDEQMRRPELVRRDDLEAREARELKSYAMRSSESRGRKHPEQKDDWRAAFARDRDRIIHCGAFRRLDQKTQVFVSRTGDNYRTRLTHSIEVSQVARSVARSLGLNEDLTEAVALAHDLGHAPFGHSGCDVLDRLMVDHGGFEQNHQSLRVVDHLEVRYPGFTGLNLSFEVRESIIKHKRPFVGAAYAEFRPDEGPLLEAQVVDECDGIAYNSHDLDDGLASGIITEEMLEELSLWRSVRARVESRWSGISGRMRVLKCVSEVINYLINDLIATTAERIAAANVLTVADVRARHEPLVALSPAVGREEAELRGFLYHSFYTHYTVHRMRNRARIFIEGLFREFVRNPKLLPPRFQDGIDRDGLERTVADYIAGMTDPYAQTEYRRLFNPFEGT
jgi:dGTPase